MWPKCKYCAFGCFGLLHVVAGIRVYSLNICSRLCTYSLSWVRLRACIAVSPTAWRRWTKPLHYCHPQREGRQQWTQSAAHFLRQLLPKGRLEPILLLGSPSPAITQSNRQRALFIKRMYFRSLSAFCGFVDIYYFCFCDAFLNDRISRTSQAISYKLMNGSSTLPQLIRKQYVLGAYKSHERLWVWHCGN